MITSRALSFRYANGPLLAFADVDVPQGGALLLTGASGSGKSTWLAMVAGLAVPTSGTLEVAGQMLGSAGSTGLKSGAATDAWRAKTIGFLPQQLHLSSALTVHDNLAMAQWAAGQPQNDERIHSALQALEVASLASRKPAQLSGGQAQRVALARAVLLQPRVILADEPTASLDDLGAAASLALLSATAAHQGATLVVASHDARVAAYFAEHSNEKGFFRMSTGVL